MPNNIKRVVTPSRYDYEEQGTVWHVLIDDESVGDIYIQISEDKNNPEWLTIGDFLALVFSDHLDCHEFINACLLAYKEKDFKDLITFL